MMNTVDQLISKYRNYRLEETLDFKKFNFYAITVHSTAIEGSTLTLIDTQLLIEENITPKGKPLEHSLMVKDHYNALLFTLELVKKDRALSVNDIQKINSLLMESTGSRYNTALGVVDASKGDFRKMNNFVGSRYFMNYSKVPQAVSALINSVNTSMKRSLSDEEALELSWKAHFDLVSIHPFVDGNGRTSRLLENFIQARYNLPLGRVYKEDKSDYFQALEETREKSSMQPFYDFMSDQYRKHLNEEISKFEEMIRDNKKDEGFSFIF